MKNIFRNAVCLLALFSVFAVISCEKQNEVKTEAADITLTVDPLEISFPAEGGFENIVVTTDAESWDFMVAASWITAERSDDGIALLVQSYAGQSALRGELVVYASNKDGGRKEVSVKVSQMPGGGVVPPEGAIAFECEEFKSLMVSACDVNRDGEVSPEEAAFVTDLALTYDEENIEINRITSLKGIEYCVNLKNLECDLNAITSLDLSGLKKLEYVDCAYNLITDLNVSGCESLKWLYFYSNEVSELNIDGCNALQFLQGYKNKVRRIDVSGLQELVYFDMRMNHITDAIVKDCPKLVVIALGDNKIASLELTGLPELYTLGCYGNMLTSLDLSHLPKLDMLECYNNNLTSLDLSANPALVMLTCQNNMISDMDIADCGLLNVLDCSGNRLSGRFDSAVYTGMERLNCGGNDFTEVNVSGCAKMTELYCDNTDIVSLDVSSCTMLETLVCNDCLLNTLDVSANGKLLKLHAQGNPLTSLLMAQGQRISDLKIDDYDVISYK